jgi:hypothetical protein
VVDFYQGLFDELKNLGGRFGFGNRIYEHSLRYISQSEGIINEAKAVDLQVLQKILPKIRGTKRDGFGKLIEALQSYLNAQASTFPLEMSSNRLKKMGKLLETRGYVDFWEVW